MTKHQSCIYTRVLFVPTLYTSLWFLIGRFGPLGDYPSFTTSTVQWTDFAQLASLGGRALLDFLLALSGTVTLEIFTFPFQLLAPGQPTDLLHPIRVSEENEEEVEEFSHSLSSKRKLLLHPVTLYTIVMTVLITYGGMVTNIRAGSFYQETYPQYIPKTERVGCVVGPGESSLQFSHDTWFNRSSALVASGAKLILWSELTAIVTEEEEFLNRTKNFAKEHGVYLGVTYGLGQPVRANKLVVVTKEGEIGINYNKAHPVPGMVSNIQPFSL